MKVILDQQIIAEPSMNLRFRLSEILPAIITIITIEQEKAGPANIPYYAGEVITDLIL